jgi:hypothetical protein
VKNHNLEKGESEKKNFTKWRTQKGELEGWDSR